MFSKGWIDGFKQRYNLKLIKLHGEESNNDFLAAKQAYVLFPTKIGIMTAKIFIISMKLRYFFGWNRIGKLLRET